MPSHSANLTKLCWPHTHLYSRGTKHILRREAVDNFFYHTENGCTSSQSALKATITLALLASHEPTSHYRAICPFNGRLVETWSKVYHLGIGVLLQPYLLGLSNLASSLMPPNIPRPHSLWLCTRVMAFKGIGGKVVVKIPTSKRFLVENSSKENFLLLRTQFFFPLRRKQQKAQFVERSS